MEKKMKPGMLLLVNYEKNMDSISLDYINLVLGTYTFGPDIKKWFSVLYHESCIKVINNGNFGMGLCGMGL